MKAANRIGMLGLGIGIVALGACEKSTSHNQAVSPTSGQSEIERADMQSFAHERSEGTSSAAKPAIGGGPQIRQITGAEAMWAIAGARCDHELVCQKIGPSAKYKTREECVSVLQKDKGADFTAGSCPDGVSEMGLSDCLRAIRAEDCGHHSIAKENACLAEKFCTPPQPGASPGGASGATGG